MMDRFKMNYFLQARYKSSNVLLDYWEELRGNGEVPLQAQISPRALKEILPQVFILGAADPQVPVYRLAGTELCERFGHELRGVPFFANWEDQSRCSVVSILRTALRRQRPVCLHTIATLVDFGWVDVEIVLVPLAFRDEGVVRFLGAMQIASDLPRIQRGTIVSQRLVASQLAQVAEGVALRSVQVSQVLESRP